MTDVRRLQLACRSCGLLTFVKIRTRRIFFFFFFDKFVCSSFGHQVVTKSMNFQTPQPIFASCQKKKKQQPRNFILSNWQEQTVTYRRTSLRGCRIGASTATSNRIFEPLLFRARWGAFESLTSANLFFFIPPTLCTLFSFLFSILES